MATPRTRRRPAGAPAARTSSREVADALGELFVCARDHFERVVEPYQLAPYCAKALHLIEGSISMKELGTRMHCDGSFVTAIADTLEERGLARREVDARDRRIKNLVITEEGEEVRERLLHDLFDDFPGMSSLDGDERATLIALLRRMVAGAGASGVSGPDRAA